MATGKSRANVFEIANRAIIKDTEIEDLPDIVEELSSHKASSNTDAHQIGNISGLQGALDGKASTVHTHNISDVSGLQNVLDSKADNSLVTQVITVITDVDFVNQTVDTANINIVDGIIVEIN